MRRLPALVALLPITLLAAWASAARAEGYADSSYHLTRLLSVGWEAARPAAGLADFVSNDSPRGLQAEVRYSVVRQLSLGVACSYNWFAQNIPRGEIAYPDALVTGPVYHRAQIITLRATGHLLLTRGPVQPYLGVGVGGVRYDAREEIGGLAVKSTGYGLAAGPEVGLLVTVKRGLAIHLQLRYQVNRIEFAGVKNPGWYAVDLGLAFY
jgi:opacity protein-like surface antigen